MRAIDRFSRRARLACVIALAAGLAACGGGGGGDETPVGTIDLSAANRDTVAHAVVAGAMGLGGADAILGSGAAAGAQRRVADAARTTRMRPLAVSAPVVRQCNVSGTETTTVDDRDNNGTESVGDVLTIVYDHCVDTVGETWNGTATASLTQLDPDAFGFRLVYTALSTVRDGHSIRLDGATLVLATASSSAAMRMRMTADGSVVARVATPVFSDTATLLDGFVQQNDVDATSLTTTTTVAGTVRSANAGGTVVVSTEVAFRNLANDDYPGSGVARIVGRAGVLKLTAVSAADVRLDLDANEDGTFEDMSTVRWDWLI